MKIIKAVLFSVGLLFAIPAGAYEQAQGGYGVFSTNCPGANTPCFNPIGATPIAAASQYALTVASSTTLTVPAGANGAFISVENNGSFAANVNFTVDGTTPTSATGHTLTAGSMTYFAKPYLSTIKLIQTSASGAVDVTYVQ